MDLPVPGSRCSQHTHRHGRTCRGASVGCRAPSPPWPPIQLSPVAPLIARDLALSTGVQIASRGRRSTVASFGRPWNGKGGSRPATSPRRTRRTPKQLASFKMFWRSQENGLENLLTRGIFRGHLPIFTGCFHVARGLPPTVAELVNTRGAGALLCSC